MDLRVLSTVAVNLLSMWHCTTSTLTPVTSVPGDVYLAGIFTVKASTGPGGECNGQVSTSSVMELEFIKWSLRRLNEYNYIPGVRLGLIAYPTCTSEKLAGYRAVEISAAIKEKSQNIVGIVGAQRSSESESISTVLAHLPDTMSPPMISYASTSVSLSDKMRFPNFFRTIYSDQIQVQVITSLMLELEWNYISIVHENNAYGLHGTEALRMELQKHGICIRNVHGFNTTYGLEISTLSQIIRDITLPKDGAVSGTVFFGGQTSAEKFLTALTDLALGRDTPSIIFSEGVGTSKKVFKAETLAASRGNLVVSPTYQPMPDFMEHWKTIFRNKTSLLQELPTNPWLKDVFYNIKGCFHTDPSCSVPTEEETNNSISKNVYIKFAQDAICMFAKALKDAKSVVCLNDSCSSLQVDGISKYFDAVKTLDVNVSDFESIFSQNKRLAFDENGDMKLTENVDVFSVYNHRKCLQDESQYCFIQIANFTTNKIMMNRDLLKDYDQSGTERSYHKAQCKQGDICTSCLRQDDQIYYKPGDLVIVAAFPIRNVGTTPLQCGGLRSNVGLDVALAVEHAVERINNDSSIFDGTNIGFIILDTCNDPLIIQDRILRLFRRDGYHSLPSDITNRILGYVGSLGSTPTIAMTSVTKDLQGKPQVGCCSTSPDLSDRELYPNFVRVSTPLTYTADAMVHIAKKLGALYIQVIYSSGSYGKGGKDAIVFSAKKHGVCVASEIEVPEKSNYISVLEKLRVKPSAKVVLTFLRSHVGPHVMQVIADKMQSEEFYFIASETLGTRQQYLIPRLKGTLSVAQEMPQSPSYLHYLETKYPKPTDDNSWLLDVIQSRQGCFYPWSFNKSTALSRECDQSDHLYNKDSLLIDPWAAYLLNAALALLKGSADALRNICFTTKTICPGYSDTAKVLQYIKDVKLDLNENASLVPVFDENGNGKYGHRIYLIASEEGKLSYKIVGHQAQATGLVFNKEAEIFPGYKGETKCPNPHDCKFCESFLNDRRQNMDDGGQIAPSQTPLIAGVGVTSFLALLFFLLFTYQCWKLRKGPTENDHYVEANIRGKDYLDVQHVPRPDENYGYEGGIDE